MANRFPMAVCGFGCIKVCNMEIFVSSSFRLMFASSLASKGFVLSFIRQFVYSYESY